MKLNENYIDSIGPQMWSVIHIEALKITLKELSEPYSVYLATKRKEYMVMFEYLINNMTCICKNHAYQLLMINNPKFYKYIFQYTVDFHNQVNKKLNKPILTYGEVLDKYKKYVIN